MSIKDKNTISKDIPENFNEIITGVMLGDGTIRMNGSYALLSIQQTDELLVQLLWSMCNKLNLVSLNVKSLTRINKESGKEKKKVFYFQTLTFPYFTDLYKKWYELDSAGKRIRKKLPLALENSLTPVALAHWVMGDGTFDSSGRHQRIIICTDSFNLEEINVLRSILLDKYNISTRIKSGKIGDKVYYRISITGEDKNKFQDLVKPFMVSSLLCRIGLK